MSSYMVGDKTLNVVLSALAQSDDDCFNLGYSSRDTLLEALFRMNRDAVEVRYGKEVDFPLPMLMDYIQEATNKYVVLKCLDCYLYQCSEGDCPKLSLYQEVEKARNKLVNKLIAGVPAYQVAPWGID